jgi:Family of unknown function (DUF6335)
MAKRTKRKRPKQSSDSEPQPREILVDPARFENPDDRGSESQQARAQAAAMAGDEEPGGTVETPDHDSVDEWAAALGVERSPDSPVRGSAEILDERDRRRAPGGADLDKQHRSI